MLTKRNAATTYSIAASFLGAAAGGAWLGLVFMSLAGLYGHIPLWQDLLVGAIAGGVVSALAILCSRVAGRLSGLRVVLVAVVAALNVAIVLYLFGDWICQVSPAGPAFTECHVPAPLGGLPLLDATLLASPSMLATVLVAYITVRDLLRDRRAT